MRIAPGLPIPFWLRIYDGNPSVFVVAHVTSLQGVEQAGSPVTLTYSGNRGIYVGVGPVVATSDLRVDYEVFTDSGLTIPSKKYLPSWEDVEADISNSYALSQILGKIANIDPNTIVGYVDQTILQGTLDLTTSVGGQVVISETQGTIDNSEVEQGLLDETNITGGEIL